jgi:hypothetical protein
VIRAQRLRVGPPAAALLPLDSAWPAGHVVPVTAARTHASYFAVPRGLRRLVEALVAERGGGPAPDIARPSDGECAPLGEESTKE